MRTFWSFFVALFALSYGTAFAQKAKLLPTAPNPSRPLAAYISPVIIGDRDIDVRSYGAACNGNTDDTAAFDAATQAGAKLGGVISVPTGNCVLGSTFTLAPNESLEGQGPGETHLVEGAPNITPLIQFGGVDDAVRDLDINSGRVVNKAGVAIVMGDFFNEEVQNITVEGQNIGIEMNGGQPMIDRTTINSLTGGSGSDGIIVGNLTHGAGTIDPRITRTSVGGQHTVPANADVLVEDAGGLYESEDDLLFANYGNAFLPGAGQVVQWTEFSNTVIGDTNIMNALYIDAPTPSSVVEGAMFSGVWASSARHSGISINNSHGTVNGIHFVGLQDYGNNGDGMDIDNSSIADVTIDGAAFCNEAGNRGDIHLAFGVDNVTIEDSTLSKICDNGVLGGAAYGIALDGDNRGIIVIGNNFGDVPVPITGHGYPGADNIFNANAAISNRPDGATIPNILQGATEITDSAKNSSSNFTLDATANGRGANVLLRGNGSITPDKTIRVDNGKFQIIDNANTAAPLSLTDSGDLAVSGQFSAASTITGNGYDINGRMLNSAVPPLIISGFGSAPTQSHASGTAAFTLIVGARPGTTGKLKMPAAADGWACDAQDLTTQNASVAFTRETQNSQTSVTFTQFNLSMIPTPWRAGDMLLIKCTGY